MFPYNLLLQSSMMRRLNLSHIPRLLVFIVFCSISTRTIRHERSQRRVAAVAQGNADRVGGRCGGVCQTYAVLALSSSGKTENIKYTKKTDDITLLRARVYAIHTGHRMANRVGSKSIVYGCTELYKGRTWVMGALLNGRRSIIRCGVNKCVTQRATRRKNRQCKRK